MTDAIEAGARAIGQARLRLTNGSADLLPSDTLYAQACIEAAIASGALVPREEAIEASLQALRSAVAEMRERCAAILSAEITGMELHKFTFNGVASTDSKGNDLFIAKSEVERLLNERTAAIRQLDLSPACGDYVVVPREPSAAMLDEGVSFALNVSLSSQYRWTQYVSDIYKTMLHAATRTGGGK